MYFPRRPINLLLKNAHDRIVSANNAHRDFSESPRNAGWLLAMDSLARHAIHDLIAECFVTLAGIDGSTETTIEYFQRKAREGR